MVIDVQHYLSFLEAHKKDIQRIARHSRGESQPEDVQGEIWLVADELSQKRSSPIDFSNPEDQKLLISHTYQKLVRYCETNVRYAARLDNTDPERNYPNYADRLTNGDTGNPLNTLLTQADIPSATSVEHHSLGDAWVTVLDRCNNTMTSVAYFLKISLGHSYRCFNQALHVAQHQQPLPLSLPDNTTLHPRPWRRYRRYRKPEQLAFAFDEELPFR